MQIPKWLRLSGNELPPGWQQRGAAALEWSTIFGVADTADIRRFLEYVTDSFLLSDGDANFIRPSDRPADVYQHNYRGWRRLGGDTLEWERFVGYLESKYSVTLAPSEFETISFGDIYRRCVELGVATVGVRGGL